MIPVSAHETLRRWSLACACFALLLFFFSPAWSAFQLGLRIPQMQWMIEVRRGMCVIQQLENPGAEIQDVLHRVIQWRLLFPAIGHVLHLPPVALFSIAPLGCLLVLAYIVTLLRRAGLEWLTCILASTTLGAASWFFTSTGWLGYFDSWLALGLLILAFSPAPWAVWLACLWAPWVDERFVVAAPLALLCRYVLFSSLQQNRATELKSDRSVDTIATPSPLSWTKGVVIPGILLLAFVGVRLGVLQSHTAEGATMSGYLAGHNFLNAPISRIGLGLWDGLRGGWFFVGLALFALRRQTRSLFFLSLTVLATAAVGLATAQDYSRSITMLLPAAVLGALMLREFSFGKVTPSSPLGLVAGCALLLPAHHVMNDQVRPIFYLYHELAAFENPPAAAMPEFYELRAIHEMERGEFASAESYLTLAIKLASNPASPSRQRGILYASQGRWPDALRDFSTVVEHDPKNPDAWFMRAQANFATGASSLARSDMDRALSLAAPGWSQRADVTRFLTKLNASRP